MHDAPQQANAVGLCGLHYPGDDLPAEALSAGVGGDPQLVQHQVPGGEPAGQTGGIDSVGPVVHHHGVATDRQAKSVTTRPGRVDEPDLVVLEEKVQFVEVECGGDAGGGVTGVPSALLGGHHHSPEPVHLPDPGHVGQEGFDIIGMSVQAYGRGAVDPVGQLRCIALVEEQGIPEPAHELGAHQNAARRSHAQDAGPAGGVGVEPRCQSERGAGFQFGQLRQQGTVRRLHPPEDTAVDWVSVPTGDPERGAR